MDVSINYWLSSFAYNMPWFFNQNQIENKKTLYKKRQYQIFNFVTESIRKIL